MWQYYSSSIPSCVEAEAPAINPVRFGRRMTAVVVVVVTKIFLPFLSFFPLVLQWPPPSLPPSELPLPRCSKKTNEMYLLLLLLLYYTILYYYYYYSCMGGGGRSWGRSGGERHHAIVIVAWKGFSTTGSRHRAEMPLVSFLKCRVGALGWSQRAKNPVARQLPTASTTLFFGQAGQEPLVGMRKKWAGRYRGST